MDETEQTKTIIVEEVPEVPSDEKWFLKHCGEFQFFSTLQDAKDYCNYHNLAFDIERFEP